MPDFVWEKECGRLVAGVDEAGRGPLAGPVVAAAVLFEQGVDENLAASLDDSKKLSKQARERAFSLLKGRADVKIGVGAACVAEIDRHNIFQATFLAMQRAIIHLPYTPDHILVDGKFSPIFASPSTCIVKGDSLSFSIAAASIVAKTIRDRLMVKLAGKWPDYSWEKNMGYPTKSHKAILQKHGPCIHHRKSFAPVRQALKAPVWRMELAKQGYIQ